MRITSISLPLLGLITALTTFTVSAEDYYKWVDDQGVTHYGERPPKNTAASRGKTQTGHSAPTPYISNQDKENTAEATSETANQKDPERCKAAKSNLDIINTSPRIKVKGEDGEFSYLSQEEIAKRKQEALQAIKESC